MRVSAVDRQSWEHTREHTAALAEGVFTTLTTARITLVRSVLTDSLSDADRVGAHSRNRVVAPRETAVPAVRGVSSASVGPLHPAERQAGS